VDETPIAFRDAMSRWASGVTVVGASHNGLRAGLVASSFTSVSADPPTVLVCVDKRSRSLATIESAGAFAVSVLATSQDLAFRVFAGIQGEVGDKFAACGDAVRTGPTGAPMLLGSLAWFDCQIVATHDGGHSHVILIGTVVECGVSPDPTATPLLYYSRATRKLADT
jgi:flavin reductase (DIM6/NTAB) family NADH-FMN oxidoreductase RutF